MHTYLFNFFSEPNGTGYALVSAYRGHGCISPLVAPSGLAEWLTYACS